MAKKTQRQVTKNEDDLAKSIVNRIVEVIKSEDFAKSSPKKEGKFGGKNVTSQLIQNSQIVCSKSTQDEIDDAGWLCI